MSKLSVPLREYLHLYELGLAYEGKTPKILSVYLCNLKRFTTFLNHQPEREPMLSDLTPGEVMAYVAAMKIGTKYEGHPYKLAYREPISPASLDQHIRTIKGFATWLYEKGYTRTNVLKTLPRPKMPSLTIEPLTEDEIKRVLASINTRTAYGARNYAIIVVLLDTGLRCGELCGLLLDDVHLDGKHCYVKVLGKGQKERLVYLGRRAVEAMLKYKTFVRPLHAGDGISKSFFVTNRGRPMTNGTVEHMMADVAKVAGVPRLHPHLLRHTTATQYLANGGDVISLQRKLGHSGLEMTNRYVHLAADQLAVIQERVAPMDKIDIKPMREPRSD
jgi:site-specific recombinase XerD